MKGTAPIITCDAEDGMCGAWDVDHYESCASAVGGVRITSTQRSPGWQNSDDEDLCPEHAPSVRPDAADDEAPADAHTPEERILRDILTNQPE